MNAVLQMQPSVGTKAACTSLGLSRATVYRRRSPKVVTPSRRPSPHRRLNQAERAAILLVLHEPRFVDQAPQEICRSPRCPRNFYMVASPNHMIIHRLNQKAEKEGLTSCYRVST